RPVGHPFHPHPVQDEQLGGGRMGHSSTLRGHRKLLGQIIVRHMCATGDPSNPRPSFGCRKFRPTTSSNSSNETTTFGSNEYRSLIVTSREVMYHRCLRASSASRHRYSGGRKSSPK